MRLCRLPLLVLFMLAACSHQPPPRAAGPKPRDENYHGGPNALLLKYDANKDGVLTRDELTAGLKAEFAADSGGKACLDPDQVAAINQARVAADQSTATPLMDWNNDGCIDFTEYSAAAYSLFDQLDRNNDGKVDAKEFNPGDAKQGAGAPSGQPERARRGRGGAPPGGQSQP